MHGQRKKDVKVLSAEERNKKEEQGAKIIAMIDELLSIRHGDKTVANPNEYCDLLAKMCPDLPTIYNFKREVVLKTLSEVASSGIPAQYKVLQKELMMATILLKMSPKSYSIWSYRQWLVLESRLLENQWPTTNEKEGEDSSVIPVRPSVVENELKLCYKMLELDERNFHCWNYRNWLISDVEKNSQELIDKEIAYTLVKYEKNFSNFSALHFRAKSLVKKQFESSESTSHRLPFRIPIQTIRDELELIKNSIFIQPNEQGVWLYHKWLLRLLVPFRFIAATHSEERTSIVLTASVKFELKHAKECIKVIFEGEEEEAQPSEFSLDVTSKSDNGGGVSQVIIVRASRNVKQIIVKQNYSAVDAACLREYSIGKTNLLESVFEWDASTSKFALLDSDSEGKMRSVVQKILEEEREFVESVAECEPNSKFTAFQLLLLHQLQQEANLVFEPANKEKHIEETQQILTIIEKLKQLAKGQKHYIENLSKQYARLLQIQEGEDIHQTDKETSATASYELYLLVPYIALHHM